jgi:Glycosyl transferases group 1
VEFRARHGRKPRVLHIGNIANNAFYNAKILNQDGFDCDVMCADYYHMMGCPEWEEADFIGTIADQFWPDWTAVDLQGYERPRWFAQGPQQLCIEYLIAKRAGNKRIATDRWQELGIANKTFGTLDHATIRRSERRARWRHRVSTVQQYVTAAREHPDALQLTASLLGRFAAKRGAWGQVARAILLPVCLVGVSLVRLVSVRPRPDEVTPWLRVFHEQFPDRPDQAQPDDLIAQLAAVPRWQPLFARYDAIIAYATEGIVPLLAGVPYFCLEHGTLREIPYRDSGEGRRTALAYRMAEHAFVTNFDCLDNARRLAPGKFTLINHPFDEDQGMTVTGWEAKRAELEAELDCDTVFFFPTRHDWVSGTGYADKSNDVFIRALATLRRDGHRVGMVCCGWGANIEQSKALIADLGIGRHVKWISPLPTVQFERMCRAAHCVVDQFKLGSFGGVMFKAMAVGAPMLTYLDEAQLRRQFPEIPPVINCRTTDDIVATLQPLLRSHDELERYGAAARAWMRRHHGKTQTVRFQAEQFRHLLFPQAAPGKLRATAS